MDNKLNIKTIVAIGIGSAVFMILARFAAIPTGVPNTELQIAFAFLALMAIIYGPTAGFAIGFIGNMLKDLTAYGVTWFSWITGAGIVGLIIGLAWKKIKIEEGQFSNKEMLIFNVYQVIANVVAWGIVAPTLDIAIYAEPADKVYLQGAVAGITNIITIAVIGTALLYTYSKSRVKKGSLDRE